MRLTQIIAFTAIVLVSTLVVADDSAEQTIRKSLANLQLDTPIKSISASPMVGLYEVKLKGSHVLYASTDGQYIVQGYMFKLKDGKPINLTEQAERLDVSKLINGIPVAEAVVYQAIGETKTHITVFTDTTCSYCRKLHAEVPALNKLGVEVRYVAFPRQGLGSLSYDRLQAVWCSADKKAAMDKMVHGQKVKAAKCANPVSKQFALGQSIGVSGTPAIVLADGQVIRGYQPAPQIAKLAVGAK